MTRLFACFLQVPVSDMIFSVASPKVRGLRMSEHSFHLTKAQKL